jgi:hypothetical protein
MKPPTLWEAEPTVRTDFRSRVIPFRDRPIADQEAAVWRSRGYRARIIERKGVYNVVVSE